VQILELAKGWSLVGDGPSYLLFHTVPEKEVTHLSTGFFRELRDALKGRSAIENEELVPLVRTLSLSSAAAIYDIDGREDARRRKAACYVVVQELGELLCPFSQDQVFEKRLRKFASLIRAARRLEMYHTPPPEAPGASSLPSPPGSFSARDRYGQRFLIVSNPHFAFRVEPDSLIARCAQELWRTKEPTKPYRVPTRAELREYLCLDKATVTKLCRAEGFTWLPRAQAGRPRRRWTDSGRGASKGIGAGMSSPCPSEGVGLLRRRFERNSGSSRAATATLKAG
jgi:hypothetical protein